MTTTWYSAPPRRPLPLWAKLLIGTVVAAVLGCLLLMGALVVGLSGGLDDVLDVRKPTRDSRHVVEKRRDAQREVPSLHESLTAGLPAVDTGVRVARDDCEQGQHNWKIDDDFDLDCVLARGSVLVAQDPAQAAAVAAALGASLDGWTPVETTGDARRWVQGGEREAGGREVVVRVLPPGRVATYDVGAGYGEGSGVTRAGAPYDAARLPVDFPGTLVVVTTSERYVFE